MSESLWPHGLQHARLPCPSPTTGACSNSCPSSQWCHPTISSSVFPLSSCLQSFTASYSFSSKSVLCIRCPKYWSVSFSISPSNEYSGLISFRIDWLDLADQGTLKSLLQHHSSKASILQRSAFFMVQLSQPYMITGKTIALTRRTKSASLSILLKTTKPEPPTKTLLLSISLWNTSIYWPSREGSWLNTFVLLVLGFMRTILQMSSTIIGNKKSEI